MSTTERQVIGHCDMCGVEILADHPYAWCSKCGTSLPPNVKEKLGQPQRQDPARPSQPQQEGTALMVEGRPVPCPICQHDRFRMKKTLMESKAAAFLDVEWASPSADTFICLRCGHVMWFMRE